MFFFCSHVFFFINFDSILIFVIYEQCLHLYSKLSVAHAMWRCYFLSFVVVFKFHHHSFKPRFCKNFDSIVMFVIYEQFLHLYSKLSMAYAEVMLHFNFLSFVVGFKYHHC